MGFTAACAILLAIIPEWLLAGLAFLAFFPFLLMIVLVERYSAKHGLIGPLSRCPRTSSGAFVAPFARIPSAPPPLGPSSKMGGHHLRASRGRSGKPARRSPSGGRVGPERLTPAVTRSQEITESDVHISPVPGTLRPHTCRGRVAQGQGLGGQPHHRR
jgi:hypothetical protein